MNELKTLGQHPGRRIDEVDRSLSQRLDENNRRLGDLDRSQSRRIDGNSRHIDTVEAALRDLGGQQLIQTRYVKGAMERAIARLDGRAADLPDG